MTTTTASAYQDRLRQNTDDWYADRIGIDEFKRRQESTWREIDAAGLSDDVLALWRASQSC